MEFSPSRTHCSLEEFFRLLIPVAKMLIECGCSSNRVEFLAETLGASWDIEVEAMAIPTGMWVSARRGKEQKIDMVRIRNWSVDLDRLSRLNALVESIEQHKVSIREAEKILEEERNAPPPYSVGLTLLAGAGSSSVLMYFFHGSILEISLAFPVGACIQLLQKYLFVGESRRYLGDFLSSVFAAIYALSVHQLFPSVDVPKMIIAGIILLVPGLVLTNAVHELAQKNLVSGAAKLLEAMMITGALAFGVVLVMSLFT